MSRKYVTKMCHEKSKVHIYVFYWMYYEESDMTKVWYHENMYQNISKYHENVSYFKALYF